MEISGRLVDLATSQMVELRVTLERDYPRLKAECKDCYRIWMDLVVLEGPEIRRPSRPATKPGPRCVTHDREEKKRRSELAKDNRLLATYGITAEEYWAIYDAQGGRCAFRCRATGKTKRLAVDHDHGGIGSSRYQKKMDLMPAPEAMRLHVRGLLCGPHNQFLAEIGDDPEVFEEIAAYLRNKPAQAILASMDAIRVPSPS